MSFQHPILKAELEKNFPDALYQGGKRAAPLPALTAAGDYAHDLFISYRQKEPDKTWVCKTISPGLERERLRAFANYRNFLLGAPLVFEIARGVEQSRCTLAISSRAYLTSNII